MNRRSFVCSAALLPFSQLIARDAWAQKSRGEFVVGQSVDLSGPLQNLGRDYFTGAKIAFDQANAAGGTVGRKWRFVQMDDGGEPRQAVANVTRLLGENKADVLFGFTGDACTEAVLASPAFQSSGRVLFGPMSGISLHRDEGRALYLRTTYAEEVVAILEQFGAGGMSGFTLAHTPNVMSMQIRDAAMEQLSRRKLPLPPLILLKEDGSNAAALAKGLARNPPNSMVILADTIPAALLAKQLRVHLPGLFIGVTSMVDAGTLQQMLGPEMSFGLVVTRVVPNPNKGTEPIVREFQRALAKYLDEAPTAAGLEGYIAARLLIETARRSPDNIGTTQSLQGLKTLNLGGISFSFGKGERASRLVDTSMIARKGGMVG